MKSKLENKRKNLKFTTSGFTLIELLGVILIISLLVIIVLPKITNSVNNFMPKTDKLMMNMIEDAAKLYVEDNINSFEENEYGYYCVPLTELVNNDYLKEGIELAGKDATYTKSLRINYNEDNKIEIVDSNKCEPNLDSTGLAAGLYDENDVLLASWDELIDAGLDVEMKLSSSTSSTNKNILDSYGDSYKLVIDDSIDVIGTYAFYNCSKLTSVVIPNSVSDIGSEAFVNCKSLTNITIPDSVASIENRAFNGCSKLTRIMVDENNSVYDSRNNSNAIIETASNMLIVGCKNTVIPNSVTNIGDYAFNGHTDLTNIIIPESVMRIGASAFKGCSGLKSITIPESVTYIIGNPWRGCTNLTSIIVDENNSVYDSRNNSNAIIQTTSDELITGCKNTTIPESVTSIGWGAFEGCSGLKSITIPNSVTSIGSNAFADSGLTSIVLPDSIKTISYQMFRYCMGLTSVTIPSSVTSIENWAFYGCYRLTSITIPSSVTTIANGAFDKCQSLTTIYYSGTATDRPWGATNATVVPE